MPFTIPQQAKDGRYVRAEQPEVHFMLADSGSQICCVPRCVLEAFPTLKKYFSAEPDVVKGVGNIQCKVYGSLKAVPISLGGDQAPGSVLRCDFRVLEGNDY